MQTLFLAGALSKQTLDALFLIVTRLSGRGWLGVPILQEIPRKVKKSFIHNQLMSRLVRDRLRGQEVFDKAARERIEKLLNSLVARRFENESRVMEFVDAKNDFVIVVRRSVWMLLSRQGKNHPGVIASHFRKFV